MSCLRVQCNQAAANIEFRSKVWPKNQEVRVASDNQIEPRMGVMLTLSDTVATVLGVNPTNKEADINERNVQNQIGIRDSKGHSLQRQPPLLKGFKMVLKVKPTPLKVNRV
jgi:hypothetical protein